MYAASYMRTIKPSYIHLHTTHGPEQQQTRATEPTCTSTRAQHHTQACIIMRHCFPQKCTCPGRRHPAPAT